MRGSTLAAVLLSLAACDGPAAPVPSQPQSQFSSPSQSTSPSPSLESVARLVAAGDIASCDNEHDSATAALVAEIDGTVATLGDNVYPAGSAATYAECYAPAWGDFLDRTRPAIGNHDVGDDGGEAFHAYFGDRAGTPGAAWYSYEIGNWHAVVLDSNCRVVDCEPGTPQHDWLVADLAASEAPCTIAYWHHPRYSSGPHGANGTVAPFWKALHADGADVVLVGHDHLYERMAPQTPAGKPDPDGIRQFTVGTGGKELYETRRVARNSELIIEETFGVLELTLHPDSYEWRFLTVDGAEADSGSATCH